MAKRLDKILLSDAIPLKNDYESLSNIASPNGLPKQYTIIKSRKRVYITPAQWERLYKPALEKASKTPLRQLFPKEQNVPLRIIAQVEAYIARMENDENT